MLVYIKRKKNLPGLETRQTHLEPCCCVLEVVEGRVESRTPRDNVENSTKSNFG